MERFSLDGSPPRLPVVVLAGVSAQRPDGCGDDHMIQQPALCRTLPFAAGAGETSRRPRLGGTLLGQWRFCPAALKSMLAMSPGALAR